MQVIYVHINFAFKTYFSNRVLACSQLRTLSSTSSHLLTFNSSELHLVSSFNLPQLLWANQRHESCWMNYRKGAQVLFSRITPIFVGSGLLTCISLREMSQMSHVVCSDMSTLFLLKPCSGNMHLLSDSHT